ncbi:MAG: ABC transporter permease [Candidatus Poribacteria bacterium]|nr:ABC transporter permease [Candidatus Poribacteria bacterium]
MFRILEGLLTGWRVLSANKLRSILTMLGIIIGTGGGIGTMSFGDGARQLVMLEVEKIGGTSTFNVQRPSWVEIEGRWQPNPSSDYLTMRDVELIEAMCPSVASVTPELTFGVNLETDQGSKFSDLRGTTGVYQNIRNWFSDIGRFVDDSDVSLWKRVVVIGSEVAGDLFGSVNPIGQELRVNNQRFTVVGVMESKGGGDSPGGSLDSQIYIPVTTAQATFSGNNRIPRLLLKARTPELLERAQQEVEIVLRRYHGDIQFFRIYSEASDMQNEANIIGGAIQVVLGAIAAMSLVVAGIGILNIMLVSVAERIREIGIRKAVGATRLDIGGQFLLEGILICLIGSAMGLMFGWVMERALAYAVVEFIMQGNGEWPSLLSWSSAVLSITAGTLTGVVAGLAPAMRAANLPPTEALRHQ